MGPRLPPERVGVQEALGSIPGEGGGGSCESTQEGSGLRVWLGPLAEPPPPGSANRKGRGPGSQEPGHQRSVGVSAPSCPPLLPSGRLPQAEGVGSSGVPATLCSGQPDATSTPQASRWFLTVPTALSPRPPPPSVAQEPRHHRSEPLLGVRSLRGARVPPSPRPASVSPMDVLMAPQFPSWTQSGPHRETRAGTGR